MPDKGCKHGKLIFCSICDSEPKQKCGHKMSSFYSICSMHGVPKADCGMCNTGRCIECIPEIPLGSRFPTYDRNTGEWVEAFPNLGVRVK
jgi:hypothetical protein